MFVFGSLLFSPNTRFMRCVPNFPCGTKLSILSSCQVLTFLPMCNSQEPLSICLSIYLFIYLCMYLFIIYFSKNIYHENYLLKLLSVQYSIVNYKYNAIQQISRNCSSCITETLYPLNSNSLFPPPSPGSHHSTLLL